MNTLKKLAVGAAIASVLVGGAGVASAQSGGPGGRPGGQPDQRMRGMVVGVLKQVDGQALMISTAGIGGMQAFMPNPGADNRAFPNPIPGSGNQPGAPGQAKKTPAPVATPNAPPQQRPPIAPPQREVRVTTNVSTTYLIPGKTAATLADLKAGDRVAVLLSAESDQNALIAKSVAVMPAPAAVQLGGKVSGVSASGFTLSGPRNAPQQQIKIVAGTRFVSAGDPAATISSLQNDDQVMVIAKPMGEQVFEAQLILSKADKRDAGFSGLVVNVSGSTFTLWQMNGSALTVDASKAIFQQGNDLSGSISDIQVGMMVRVIGARDGDKVNAQIVQPGPAVAGKGAAPGVMRMRK
ncbi:MAG: hypothetical protein K1X39_13450 [Thermoflexales bacterium]|nr:hypothetical protein [Thermoflexales bacterium]